MTLEEIQKQTKVFADAHKKLSDIVQELNEEMEALKRRKLGGIKAAVVVAAEARVKLKTEIELSPDLFVKPRTLVVHGIKIGMTKGKGGIEFDDPDKVVERIEKFAASNFAVNAEDLLHIKKSPNKEALENLDVADLKKLGCTVVAAGDQVVIKPTDSDVDKIVTALLKDAAKEAA